MALFAARMSTHTRTLPGDLGLGTTVGYTHGVGPVAFSVDDTTFVVLLHLLTRMKRNTLVLGYWLYYFVYVQFDLSVI